MKKRTVNSKFGLVKGFLLVLCLLLLFGTQAGQSYAQLTPDAIDWNTTITYTVKPSYGYDYNFTAFGFYNGTHYNLYYPLNYSGDLPLIIQFGGYAGNSNDLANLEEDSPLCGHLASQGYAVLEFGYDTGGTIPEASQTCYKVLKGTILPWVENDSFPWAIDKSKVALCGHSAGGSAVLGLAEPNIATSVALTPYYLSTSLVPEVKNVAPTLILTGQGDTLVPYNDNGTAYYSGLVAPKAILDITGADHNLGVGTFDLNTAGTAPTLRYVTAWFDAVLKGNSTAASLFTAASLSDDPQVNIYQIDIPSFSTTPPQRAPDNTIMITLGITIAVTVSMIGGYYFYQTRKRTQNLHAR
jgi:fermentation-respiration switch protein FrsA (DUF1100 family)